MSSRIERTREKSWRRKIENFFHQQFISDPNLKASLQIDGAEKKRTTPPPNLLWCEWLCERKERDRKGGYLSINHAPPP